MKRIMAAVLACLLLLTGCGGETEPTTEAPTTLPAETTVPVETTETPTLPPETMEPEEPSLHNFRQSMTGTSAIFAVASFGWQEGEAPREALPKLCYWLCQDQPFLTQIPDGQIIGQAGELYCIVPADSDATVTVSLGAWYDDVQEYRYDKVIYTGGGAPILLYCNGAGDEPDTQVRISGPSGEAVWYPMLDDNRFPVALENEAGESLFRDFTPYGDLLMSTYYRMVDEGWELPTEDSIVGTTWFWDGWLKDGRSVYYQVSFHPTTLDIRWNDGTSQMDQVFRDIPWELSYRESIAVLTMDLGESYGVMRYDLLYDPNSGLFYFGMDVMQEQMPIGLDCQYRYLTAPREPDSADLEGLWELAWTEVEGDRNEVDRNRASMELYMAEDGLYRCSQMDRDHPQNDFYEQEVVIFPFEMYSACENQSWVAVVNNSYDDPLNIRMALIYGDVLEVRNEWEVDGMIMVSHAYYRRFID